jgi:hypothetical protein
MEENVKWKGNRISVEPIRIVDLMASANITGKY